MLEAGGGFGRLPDSGDLDGDGAVHRTPDGLGGFGRILGRRTGGEGADQIHQHAEDGPPVAAAADVWSASGLPFEKINPYRAGWLSA